jgi:VWFA-related protein
VIDVTVVDSDGRPVTDLTASDFEVSENGKPQQIISASLTRGGVPSRLSIGTAGASVTSPSPASALDPAANPNPPPSRAIPTVTAILFDSLSADARPFATRAAAQFVSTLATAHEYAAIFQSGTALSLVQPFTNRTGDLRAAIDRVARTAPSNLSPEAERMRSTARTAGLDPESPVTAGAEYGQGWTTIAEHEQRLYGPGGDPVEKMLTQLEQRMKEGYLRFLTEYEGEASISGLRAAVSALAPLPGRKSILYFTEELPITSRLKSRFETLIGEANRASISFYTVDASGLRVHSKELETSQGVNLSGAQGNDVARRSDGAWTKDLEKQEEALSSRPAVVLGRLANETGGFFIDNTNDLGKGVARMQIERTTYYLLGYQPTNTASDGKFRKVSVKVKRGKYTIRARPGYVAPRS